MQRPAALQPGPAILAILHTTPVGRAEVTEQQDAPLSFFAGTWNMIRRRNATCRCLWKYTRWMGNGGCMPVKPLRASENSADWRTLIPSFRNCNA